MQPLDMLRSCYSTTMNFGDKPELMNVPIQWYFVENGMPFMPLPSAYRSKNWTRGDLILPDALVGESATFPKPWVNGAAPATLPDANGCGNAAQWNGDESPDLCDLTDGIPSCCITAT